MALASVQTTGDVPAQVQPVPVKAAALMVTPLGRVSVTVKGLEPRLEGTLALLTSVAWVSV